MSVIIRLQNLPWSANALDIRTFFQGLSIPEGGVHIVGGELGDAFIAFSTDEDARQGMMHDGGKIKEVQVKLLLSSRSEMHKVIEAARQNVPFLQLAQAPVIPQQPMTPFSPSLTTMLSQNMKQVPMTLASGLGIHQTMMTDGPPKPAVIEPPNISSPSERDRSKDNKRGRDNKTAERKTGRSRSKSRDRDKKERSRDKKDRRERSRSRDRSRERRRRDRSRSRSRERRDRKRDRKDRSRSRGRSKEEDPRHSRDKKMEDQRNDLDPRNAINRNELPFIQPEKGGLLGDGPAKNRPPYGMMTMPVPNPPLLNAPMEPMWKQGPGVPVINQPRMRGKDGNLQMSPGVYTGKPNDPYTRLQELGNRRNPNAFQNSMPSRNQNMAGGPHRLDGPMNQSMSNSPNQDQSNYRNGPPDTFKDRRDNTRQTRFSKGCCIQMSNLAPHLGYGDIRRFFSSHLISSQGLKMINDSNGRRTGVAYVMFGKVESKHAALQRDGQVLKGDTIRITHLDDEVFENAIDAYYPSRHEKTRRYSSDAHQDSGDDVDSQKSLIIIENVEKPKEVEDKPFNVLLMEDLPASAKEHDIIKMFSDYSLLSIMLIPSKENRKLNNAYVQFVNAHDAKSAVSQKFKHMIGRKTIKLIPCSTEDYELAKNEHNSAMFEPTKPKPTQEEEFETPVRTPAPVPRDPRQRRQETMKANESSLNFQPMLNPYPAVPFQNPPLIPSLVSNPINWTPPEQVPSDTGMPNNEMIRGNGHGQPVNQDSNFDCVLLKGLPLRTTDRNILDFFSDVGIIPLRIHLMLNKQGQPSGDCFCEFNSSTDASKAATKHSSQLGPNTISIDLVSRSVVEDALEGPKNTEPRFMGGMNNDKGFMNPHMNNRGGFYGRGGPRMNSNFGPRGRGGPPRGMRGGFRGRGGGFHPPQGYNNSNPPLLDDPGLEGFGAPGCVLSLENVPFRASVDEILDFFADFDLKQDDVMRRFNERGMATGDARVCFATPFDAQRAIKQLNMCTIRDRPIMMKLL